LGKTERLGEGRRLFRKVGSRERRLERRDSPGETAGVGQRLHLGSDRPLNADHVVGVDPGKLEDVVGLEGRGVVGEGG
jgi:hypothetical protein